MGVNYLSLSPFPSACSRPSSVSIYPHPYTPPAGVPERPGPQTVSNFPSPIWVSTRNVQTLTAE